MSDPVPAVTPRAAVPPPTVAGFPLIGNLLDFRKFPREFLIDAAARYGDVFRIQSPIGPIHFIAGAVCRKIAANPEGHGLHREGFFSVFETETDVDVFGVQGERHHQLRDLLKLGYSRQVTAQWSNEISQVVTDVTSSMKPGDAIDLFKVGGTMALWSAMAMATPIDLRPWTEDFRLAGHTVMSIMVRSAPPQARLTPWYRLAKGRMWDILGEVVERHRAGEFAAAPTMSMADAFLSSKTKTGDQMDDTAVRGAVAYGVVGTEIYIGRIIGFMLYEILRDPDLASHIRREVDTAFADGVFDPGRLRRMPYLRATFLETLRFYPLLPGLAFFPSKDLEVEGYTIGKGELLFLSPQIAHFSPKFYRNPNTFDVTRAMPPRNEHLQPGSHATFGAGKRTCLAPGMVEIIALVAVCATMRRVDMTLERPTQRLELEMNPLIAPKIPVRALVKEMRDLTKTKVDIASLSESLDLNSAIEEERGKTIPSIEPEDRPAGTDLVTEGAVADAFYVLLEGTADVILGATGPSPHVIRTLEAGASFGEIGLLKHVPRTATVRATTSVRVLRVPRETFMQIVAQHDVTSGELGAVFKQRYMQQGLAKAIPAIDSAKLSALASQFSLKHYKPDEVIIQQGSVAETFYVIVSGTVSVFREAGTERIHVRDLLPGGYMGEIGILQGRPRSATCVAKTAADVIAIGRQQFVAMLGDHGAVMEDVATVVGRRLMADLARGAES